jgi:cytochrome b subunit of formate dehydrogenase
MMKIRISGIICLIKQYHLYCLDMRLDLTQLVMHVGTQNTVSLSKYLHFYHACDINDTSIF